MVKGSIRSCLVQRARAALCKGSCDALRGELFCQCLVLKIKGETEDSEEADVREVFSNLLHHPLRTR